MTRKRTYGVIYIQLSRSASVDVKLGHTMKVPKAAGQLCLGSAALLFVTMGMTPHARAERTYEFHGRSLPCNELCQAWLGLNTPGDRPDSTGESTGPAQPRRHLRKNLAAAPAPKGNAPHARPETGKAVTLHPTVPSSAGSGSQPPTPLRRPRLAATHAQERVPLPAPRPDFAIAPAAVTVVDVRPLPTPSSLHPFIKPPEGVRAPDKGGAGLASGDHVTHPASNAAAARPPAIPRVVGPAPAPSGPESPKLAREPAGNTFNAPSEVKREPGEAGRGLDDGRAAPRAVVAALPDPLPAGGESGIPFAEKAPNVAHLAPEPVLTDTERGSRDDAALTGEPHTGNLASLPTREPASSFVLVTVGQIKTDARNTYVDVVVVNTSQRKLQDLDVRCDARDAQGLQVTQGSTTIRDVPPSDVAVGQALFPSQITGDNSNFSCVVERFSDPPGSAP